MAGGSWVVGVWEEGWGCAGGPVRVRAEVEVEVLRVGGGEEGWKRW